MKQREMQTRELEDDSGEHPALQPPPPSRRAVAGAIVTLLVMALGVSVFAALSAPSRGVKAGASTVATSTVLAYTPSASIAPGPTPVYSPLQAPRRGAGLPEGVEIIAYTPTGTDEGWATGAVITNPVTGVPDRGMVLRFSGNTWTQIGPSLPGAYLSGIDMLTPSEGWVMGPNEDTGGYLLLHIQNGAWTQEPSPNGAPLGALAMRTADEGWAAVANPKGEQGGANSSLYHDAGGVWTLVPTSLHYITDIAPIADGEAWVIGWNADGTSSLVIVQGGTATVVLTSPGNSSFDHLRVFAPNDIWIEGVMHAASNADINDLPLDYHYDGVTWSNAALHAPSIAQHISIVSSASAWSFVSIEPQTPDATAYGQIQSIFSNETGQWKPVSIPYTDLQSIEVVSTSNTDIWAIGAYMVTTQVPSDSGGTSYAGIGHNVLLHYSNGSWTEYGR